MDVIARGVCTSPAAPCRARRRGRQLGADGVRRLPGHAGRRVDRGARRRWEGRTVGIAGRRQGRPPPRPPPGRGRRARGRHRRGTLARSSWSAGSCRRCRSWPRPRRWSRRRWTSTPRARSAARSPTTSSRRCRPDRLRRPTTSLHTRRGEDARGAWDPLRARPLRELRRAIQVADELEGSPSTAPSSARPASSTPRRTVLSSLPPDGVPPAIAADRLPSGGCVRSAGCAQMWLPPWGESVGVRGTKQTRRRLTVCRAVHASRSARLETSGLRGPKSSRGQSRRGSA